MIHDISPLTSEIKGIQLIGQERPEKELKAQNKYYPTRKKIAIVFTLY